MSPLHVHRQHVRVAAKSAAAVNRNDTSESGAAVVTAANHYQRAAEPAAADNTNDTSESEAAVATAADYHQRASRENATSHPVPDLPSFRESSAKDFTWGCLDGDDFASAIHRAYCEAVAEKYFFSPVWCSWETICERADQTVFCICTVVG